MTGYRIIGYFLCLSALILVAAGISMLFPGTFWSQIWSFKKMEYQQLLSYRLLVGCGFWTLAVIMTCAAIGWFRRRRWGRVMTMGIFVVNGLGDGVRLVSGSYVEGAIGVCVTAGIIFYLTRPSLKRLFN